MISCKTFTFKSIKEYSEIFTKEGGIISDWMDELCIKSPFIEFSLEAVYTNELGNVVLTYFAFKSDKVNPFYEFRHLALQPIILN